MQIPESEFILNSDGSIYHLNLLPEDIAHKIILVGDPERVALVSHFFDSIKIKKNKREFNTHTGTYKGKDISVVSTGIGTDNIDIVLNELDALVNIDFQKRIEKNKKTKLEIIRIGTSGSIQPEIDIDSFLVSEYAIGMDGMMSYYSYDNRNDELDLYLEFSDYLLDMELELNTPYCFGAHTDLLNKFNDFQKGITLTHNGFYGPQGRLIRGQLLYPNYIDIMANFKTNLGQIINFEMETAGIYGLSSMLGHSALSLNLILANRPNRSFSSNYETKMNELIKIVLDKI